MKKVISIFFLVLFVGAMITSCADAQADEVFDNIVPEKTSDGQVIGDPETAGPLG